MEEKINVRHSRFRDAPFFEKASQIEVFVGGAGGIGSYLAPYLSRIVKRIYISDYDIIEQVNLAGQNFSVNQVGESKIRAIHKIIADYGTAKVSAIQEKVTEDSDVPEKYVFAAFDNMEARKNLFSIWKENENRELFIDGRLLADQYEVYFVQKGQEERYEATLFSDDEVPNVACTFKQTSHFAAICAARMVHGFTNYLSQDMFYKIPFHVSEEGNLFHFEVKENATN